LTAALALGAAAVGSGVFGAESLALADTSPTIVQATIYPAGGGTQHESITADQLENAGASCPAYGASSMLENGGNATPDSIPLPSTTWTVGSVLRCMNPSIDPASVNQIAVIGNDGSPENNSPYSTLTRADLAAPSDYLDSAENPVISFNGTSTSNNVDYNRPRRTAADPDEHDHVHTEGQPVQLQVYLGATLHVTANGSPSGQVVAGTAITFTAQATTSDPVTYTWTFNDAADQQSATGATAKVTYQTPGTWQASVRAFDPTNGATGSAVVPVLVGPAQTSTGPTHTGTTPTSPTQSTPQNPPPTGGGGGGGGGNPPGNNNGNPNNGNQNGNHNRNGHHPTSGNHGGAPHREHSSSSPNPTHHHATHHQHQHHQQQHQNTSNPPPPPASGGTGNGNGNGGGAGNGSTGDTGSTSPDSPQAPTTAPQGSRPHNPFHAVNSKTKGPPSGARHHHQRKADTSGEQGHRVTGLLISAVDTAPPGASPLVHGAPAADRGAKLPTGNRHAQTSTSPWAIILSVLVVLGLMGLGAARELRARVDWRSLRARLIGR
jgi:hypothetical protein